MPPKPTRTPEQIEIGGGFYFKLGPGALGMQLYGMYHPNGRLLLEYTWTSGLVEDFMAALQSPAGEWRPIATAPKDGGDILGWSEEWNSHQVMYWHEGEDGKGWATPHRLNGYMKAGKPTYWLPLPPAPTGEG